MLDDGYQSNIQGIVRMTVEIMADANRLSLLLNEALTIADGLELPIVAIHIDQALSQLSELDGNTVS